MVIGADSDVVQLLNACLECEGYDVLVATDGPEALQWIPGARPDAILFDTDAPGTDGSILLSGMQSFDVKPPVLIITQCDAVQDRVSGLTAGADDYITKPFAVEEVIARLWAVLRRTHLYGDEEDLHDGRLEFCHLVVDETTHEVWVADESVALSPLEFELLRYLIANAGIVLTKGKIIDRIWAGKTSVRANTVESCVSSLRRKVDRRVPPMLQTLRGVGYVLRVPDGSRTTEAPSPG